jgi:hypothetical protein
MPEFLAAMTSHVLDHDTIDSSHQLNLSLLHSCLSFGHLSKLRPHKWLDFLPDNTPGQLREIDALHCLLLLK